MRALGAALATSLVVASCGGASQPTTTLAAFPRTSPPSTTAAATRTAAPAPTGRTCVPINGPAATTAVIELAKGGTITLTLRPDKAPSTVANFVARARGGCYDGLKFHRVEPNFVIQGGDPLGTGTGGGDQATELSDLPFVKGALGIARKGDIKVSNDMQFFVCIGECRFLDNNYTNFGNVSAGQEVADGVKVGDVMSKITVK